MTLAWRGYFRATTGGKHVFATQSGDGSALYLDLNRDGDWTDGNEMTVSDLGTHGVQSRTGVVTLVEGEYPIAVSAYWGDNDATNLVGSWDQASAIGTYTNVVNLPLSKAVSALEPARPHYYRFRATNAAGATWATPSATFTTPRVPGTLYLFR